MQQGCRCWTLWDQPWSLVAMGWRRRGSRRSMLHLLQPSTVPLDILLTAVFIAATPLSHPPGLYRDPHWPTLEAPPAWTRSASAYIALPAGAAYRLLYFVQDQQDPQDPPPPPLSHASLVCPSHQSRLVITSRPALSSLDNTTCLILHSKKFPRPPRHPRFAH
jgi:hypothetical protein